MRLIDVEQVYCAECEYKDNCKHLVDQQIIFCDVPSMPTIDAVPVVHGRWEYSGGFLCGCQNCGEIYSLVGNCGKDWNYCPNCGARMDGE